MTKKIDEMRWSQKQLFNLKERGRIPISNLRHLYKDKMEIFRILDMVLS